MSVLRGALRFPALEPPNGGIVHCPGCGTYCAKIVWFAYLRFEDFCENDSHGNPWFSWLTQYPWSSDYTTKVDQCLENTDWELCQIYDDFAIEAVFQRIMYVEVETLWPGGCVSEENAEYEALVNNRRFWNLEEGDEDVLGDLYPGYPSSSLIISAGNSYYPVPYPEWCDWNYYYKW